MASTPVITTISPATNPWSADVVIVATSDVSALLETVAVTVETAVAYSPIKPKSRASPWFAFPVNTSGSVTARFEVSKAFNISRKSQYKPQFYPRYLTPQE